MNPGSEKNAKVRMNAMKNDPEENKIQIKGLNISEESREMRVDFGHQRVCEPSDNSGQIGS